MGSVGHGCSKSGRDRDRAAARGRRRAQPRMLQRNFRGHICKSPSATACMRETGARPSLTSPASRRKKTHQLKDPVSRVTKPPLDILLCAPRGFCAGVVRAIDAVEKALSLHGAPVYVRHEIVHNKYVVESLKRKGAVFVAELSRGAGCDAAGDLLGAWRAEIGAGRGAGTATSSPSTPPVRWSPRCIARPRSITSAAGTSCSSAMPAIPRSSAPWASCRRARSR